jgi:hypothetical protein
MSQTIQFANELDKLIERFAHEWDLEYAQVVGVLMTKIFLLIEQAKNED